MHRFALQKDGRWNVLWATKVLDEEEKRKKKVVGGGKKCCVKGYEGNAGSLPLHGPIS